MVSPGMRHFGASASRSPTGRLALAVASAGLILAGCAVEHHSGEAVAPQILHVGNGAEPQDLDPHLVTGVPEHRITSTLFEGLVDLDPETLEPVPGVAEKWEVSEDATVYTFHLRKDAKWSNGDALTAQDFAYAWQRILTPTLGSEYAYMLHCIVNAREFNEGQITDFSLVGVNAIDNHTLEVRLNHPTPYFLSMQIHYTWFPVHRETVERFGTMTERGTRWTRAGNLVGNGAFRLERWEPDRVIVVVKNPFYWNKERVRPEAIHFYPIDNISTEELLFRAGRLQLTESVPVNKVEAYEKDRPEVLRRDPYLGTYFYRLNVTRPPLADVRVRRALAMAVDREDLVRNVVRTARRPASCFTPPDTAGYTCTSRIEYNVTEARRLLAEAGYPDGSGFPKVEILYNTSENHRQIAEAIQAMWRENLNIRVSLLNQEWKVYLDSMNRLDYEIARSGWIGDFLDPINFLECFTTNNGNNRTGFTSSHYDALIAEARRTPNPDQRLAVLQEAERLLLDEAPMIPLYFYTRTYLKAPEVKGLAANPLGYISFKHLRLEPYPSELTRQQGPISNCELAS